MGSMSESPGGPVLDERMLDDVVIKLFYMLQLLVDLVMSASVTFKRIFKGR